MNRTPTLEEWQRTSTPILLDKYKMKKYGWAKNSGKCNKEEAKRYRQRIKNIISDGERAGIWALDIMEHLLRHDDHYTEEQLAYFKSTLKTYPARPRRYYTIKHGIIRQ